MKYTIFSNNKKKLEELESKLSSLGMEFVSLSSLGYAIDPEETGYTFEENALIKARTGAQVSGLPCIADDSGLCVSALGGAPGVYSARYGAPAAKSDSDRRLILLDAMAGKEERSAMFVSVIACVFPDGNEITARGECHGEISLKELGDNGFGYDSIFYLPEYRKTMAEIPPSLKQEISHRAAALQILKKELMHRDK